MEREALLTQVNDALETEGRTLTLSEETINGELDDALELVTDDAQVDDTFVGRIVKRLKRMDGNLHRDVSIQVKEYKKAHPAPNPEPKADNKPKDGGTAGADESEYLKRLDALTERLEKMESSRAAEAKRAANDAIVSSVKSKLRASFKEAGVEVNEYIYKATLRDLEVPDSDDAPVDEDALAKKMERAYYRNLKDAGLGKERTGAPNAGGRGGGKGESAADRFFAKKGKKEGWKK